MNGAASGTTIGGPAAGAGNLISGNAQSGIQAGTNNLVEGNRIGTNAAGNDAIPNQGDGIDVNGTATIGGTAAGAGNLISGNTSYGIDIYSSCLVEGNLIGTDAAGTAAVPNEIVGIDVQRDRVTIGGTGAGAGNTISGNHYNGINIYAGCLIEGNRIGTDPTGTVEVPNGGYGILGVASGATIGGTTAAAANIISGNANSGIDINGATLVEGNLIGTDAAGTAALANGSFGVDVQAVGVTIGGTAAGAGNVISGNASDGVFVQQPGGLIQGNWIGTDATGTIAIPNQTDGVFLTQGTSGIVTVGTAGGGNVIADNGAAGVASSSGTTGGTIRFNSIFENAGPGIDLNDAGVVPNKPGSATNAPVITLAGDGVVSGTLNALANSTYTLDFYANPSGDASASRPQGRTYLGSTSVATNAQGNAAFSFAYSPDCARALHHGDLDGCIGHHLRLLGAGRLLGDSDRAEPRRDGRRPVRRPGRLVRHDGLRRHGLELYCDDRLGRRIGEHRGHGRGLGRGVRRRRLAHLFPVQPGDARHRDDRRRHRQEPGGGE